MHAILKAWIMSTMHIIPREAIDKVRGLSK